MIESILIGIGGGILGSLIVLGSWMILIKLKHRKIGRHMMHDAFRKELEKLDE